MLKSGEKRFSLTLILFKDIWRYLKSIITNKCIGERLNSLNAEDKKFRNHNLLQGTLKYAQ